MKYIIENTDTLGDEFIGLAIGLLSLQRLQRLDSLRMTQDRVNCAAAYLLLRYALRKEYGMETVPEFTFGAHGKPYLKDSDIFFGLSHCRNSIACVVSDRETACDINDIRRISQSTAKYFCTEEEYAKAETEADPNRALVRLWTMKECRSKLDGTGLSSDFRKFTGKELDGIELFETENYIASFYGKGSPVIIKSSDLL